MNSLWLSDFTSYVRIITGSCQTIAKTNTVKWGNFGRWGNFGQYKTFILSNIFCHLKNNLVVNMEVKCYLRFVICFKRSFIRLDPNDELIIMGVTSVTIRIVVFNCVLNLLGIKGIHLQMIQLLLWWYEQDIYFVNCTHHNAYRTPVFKVIHWCRKLFVQSFPMPSKVTPNSGVTLASNIFPFNWY